MESEADVGAIIRRWRTSKGWTQADLAHHAKVSTSIIQKVEANKSQTRATLRLLAEAMGRAIDDLDAEAGFEVGTRGESLRAWVSDWFGDRGIETADAAKQLGIAHARFEKFLSGKVKTLLDSELSALARVTGMGVVELRNIERQQQPGKRYVLLPAPLADAVHERAQLEGVHVDAWVATALETALKAEARSNGNVRPKE